MKKELTAAAMAAALAFAGCGGGDSNTESSYSDFSDEVSSICEDNSEAINAAVQAVAEGDITDQSELVGDLITPTQSEAADIAALDPPAELTEVFAEYNDIRDQRLALLKEAQDAGSPQASNAALQQNDRLQDDEFEAASKLGAAGCVGQAPPS